MESHDNGNLTANGGAVTPHSDISPTKSVSSQSSQTDTDAGTEFKFSLALTMLSSFPHFTAAPPSDFFFALSTFLHVSCLTLHQKVRRRFRKGNYVLTSLSGKERRCCRRMKCRSHQQTPKSSQKFAVSLIRSRSGRHHPISLARCFFASLPS